MIKFVQFALVQSIILTALVTSSPAPARNDKTVGEIGSSSEIVEEFPSRWCATEQHPSCSDGPKASSVTFATPLFKLWGYETPVLREQDDMFNTQATHLPSESRSKRKTSKIASWIAKGKKAMSLKRSSTVIKKKILLEENLSRHHYHVLQEALTIYRTSGKAKIRVLNEASRLCIEVFPVEDIEHMFQGQQRRNSPFETLFELAHSLEISCVARIDAYIRHLEEHKVELQEYDADAQIDQTDSVLRSLATAKEWSTRLPLGLDKQPNNINLDTPELRQYWSEHYLTEAQALDLLLHSYAT